MNRVALAVLAWILMATPSLAQSATPTLYAESYRQGSTRITEETFEAKLTPENAYYHEPIKDSTGKDRYDLSITPRMPGGDDRITSWVVRLKDFHHDIFFNLLMANQEPSEDAKNNLWKLDPNRLGPVPIRARRVIKVEGFYVVIRVKDLHFTPLDSPYLDSMEVQFALTNSDPRSSH
ncbi:MAG TPA: hypothetical protein VGM18_05565 [Candidatus Sulfotelmatobacter sp.]|jgi:hypothetical protein